jgi:eukaryotic-like serine/threonine-protein kinase
MMLTPGSELGPYKVGNPIGAGGMGEVYRARDNRLGRDVAIKVLPQHLAADAGSLARFEREARAVAALSHPNILAIFDIGREGSTVYAVTELLEGATLRQRLKDGPLPVRKAIDHAAQIAQGLAAAHDKGIIHRDIKPENVFITNEGRVKLLDFGLAKEIVPEPALAGEGREAVESPTVVLQTQAGMVVGTPAYMAPEQVRGRPLDRQADIFSFGVVLFEMLTGRRAFDGKSPAETMVAILNEDPPDVSTLDPKIPLPLAQVVRHCLEKEPSSRFQSARDIAINLQILAGMQQSTSSGVVAVASSGRGWTRTVATAAIALVMAVAAFMAGRQLAPGIETSAASSSPRFERLSYREKTIFRAAFARARGTVVYSAAHEGNVPEVVALEPGWPNAKSIGVPGSHLLAVSVNDELAVLTDARVIAPGVLRGTLARLPLGGDAPRAVAENVRDADWLPDGSDLAVVRSVEGTDRLELPLGKTLYESPGYLSDLRVSPDGERVAVFEHPEKWKFQASLIVIDRKGHRTVVAGPFAFARGLSWRPDGSEILFTASARGAGNSSVHAAALDGGVRTLLETAGGLAIHDISPDGRWLVTRDDWRTGVRVAAAGAGFEREVSWLDRSRLSAISQNGHTVLFTESAPPAGVQGTVSLRGADGKSLVLLGDGEAQSMSPDGTWVLALSGDPRRLTLLPTGVGERRVLHQGAIDEHGSATWFPDGRTVLWCGREGEAASRCYAHDLSGGAPRQVTPDGESGLVSPDGQRVVVWRPEREPAIYRMDGTAERLTGFSVDDVPVGWSGDGRGLFVFQPGVVPGRIERVEISSGRREVVRRFAEADRVGTVAVGPVSMSADLASLAYSYTRHMSTLFGVDGLR